MIRVITCSVVALILVTESLGIFSAAHGAQVTPQHPSASILSPFFNVDSCLTQLTLAVEDLLLGAGIRVIRYPTRIEPQDSHRPIGTEELLQAFAEASILQIITHGNDEGFAAIVYPNFPPTPEAEQEKMDDVAFARRKWGPCEISRNDRSVKVSCSQRSASSYDALYIRPSALDSLRPKNEARRLVVATVCESKGYLCRFVSTPCRQSSSAVVGVPEREAVSPLALWQMLLMGSGRDYCRVGKAVEYLHKHRQGGDLHMVGNPDLVICPTVVPGTFRATGDEGELEFDVEMATDSSPIFWTSSPSDGETMVSGAWADDNRHFRFRIKDLPAGVVLRIQPMFARSIAGFASMDTVSLRLPRR